MFGLRLISNKTIDTLKENLTMYARQLEDLGWINISLDNGDQMQIFGEGFKKMLKTCKLYYYKNPLAGHWVNLTTQFVFGEGVSKPKAQPIKKDVKKEIKEDIAPGEKETPKSNKEIQDIIDKFWDDRDNQISLTSFLAQQKLSNKLQYEGNLFFALFVDEEGDVKVRIINTADIADIIYDPDDNLRPIFYKIRMTSKKYNFTSDSYEIKIGDKYEYYADWENANPEMYKIPDGKLKEAVVFHVKINCDINDKFGVPELYRGIDWIKAHKDMASDLATLIKSLSMLAWKKKVVGTSAQVRSLQSAMNAKLDLTNKAVTAGSTQYENQAIDTQPVNTPTGGAAIGEKGLKQMQLMVCAASGLFYHYFGDPETGNLATTKSMELPMIKKFVAYQVLWTTIYDAILQFIINKKIEKGLLPGSFEYDEKTNRNIYTTELERLIDIDFPPLIDKDTKSVAEALEIAKRANLISDETAARIYLLAEQLNNIDEEIEKIDFTRVNVNPFSSFGQPGDLNKPFNADNGKKPVEKPVKEAITTPSHDPAVKLANKSKWVLQRMNGYRKALSNDFNSFKRNIRESLKSAGDPGLVVGNVKNLSLHLDNLQKSMTKSASAYFPVAIDIGKKYLQSHLETVKVKESLFEAQGRERTLLDRMIDWNEGYIATSLIPDIEKKVIESMRMTYNSKDEFSKAIDSAVNAFESRIEQYAGAFWRVEEAAVKEAGIGTGAMVNFAGADDESTCKGCQEAMNGNPYLIDEAPEPGSHECDGRCRHALQII